MDIYQIRPELTPTFDPLGVHPHAIPAVGVFDEPTVKTCINAEWLSHVTGMIERLLYDDAWQGNEDEIYAAQESIRQIIAAFDSSTQGNCETMTNIIGEVRSFALSAAPSGWLNCDGAAISRTIFVDLFAAIGTAFGAGDGSTTFNLPDLRGRTVVGVGQGSGLTNRALADTAGAETHQLSSQEMPAHIHVQKGHSGTSGSATAGRIPIQTIAGTQVNSVESTDSTGLTQAHNNMQPFAALLYAIYAGV